MGDSVSKLTCAECGEPITWRYDLAVILRPPQELTPLHTRCHEKIASRGLIQKLSNKTLNGDSGQRMLKTFKWVKVIMGIWLVFAFVGAIVLNLFYSATGSQIIFILLSVVVIPLVVFLFFFSLSKQMGQFVDESYNRFESQLPERKPK